MFECSTFAGSTGQTMEKGIYDTYEYDNYIKSREISMTVTPSVFTNGY